MLDYPQDEAQLDDILSLPWDNVIAMMQRLEGDIMILGIAGKMGVTMGFMAKRAIEAAGVNKKVYGVARFSNPQSKVDLEAHGIECISCDLMDRTAIAKLPKVKNILYMAGRKFGTQGTESLTWAMNVMVPHNVIEHFQGSQIVAFSTGCVYPLVSAKTGPCDESVKPAPIGEYAQSCLGRERVFEYAAVEQKTPVCLYRLNYAIDMRYGVLHDIAQAIWHDQPVDDSVPYVNIIWQADANNHALLCLEECACPAAIMNVTGAELLKTKDLALALGKELGKEVIFKNQQQELGYLNDASCALKKFGAGTVDPDTMVKWQAQWIKAGNASLGKPTHFEVSTGKF